MVDKSPPGQRPAAPRVDKAAADTGTLVGMGVVPEPPKPVPPPPPGPSPTEQANEASIQKALSDAGVTKTSGDEQVIDVLAKLAPVDVAVVTRWLTTTTKPTEAPPPK